MSLNFFGRRAAFFLALVLALTACGSNVASDADTADAADGTETPADETPSTEAPSDDTATDAPADDAPAPAPAGDEINGGKPVVEVPAGDPPLELGIDDLIEGDGPAAAVGDMLVMHYVGVLHANGEQFDASWDRGSTFNFTLGQGRVIQGWDEGIVGMKKGGRRLLNIPSAQAYGSNGQGGIPADSALVFVVDLVDVLTPPAPIENAPAPVTELEVTVVDEGDGPVIDESSFVEIHYQLMLQSTGQLLDSSWSSGQTLSFSVSQNPPLPGWGEGLVGKREGDTVRMIIPPALGVGPENGQIDPDETLVTEVLILSVTN